MEILPWMWTVGVDRLFSHWGRLDPLTWRGIGRWMKVGCLLNAVHKEEVGGNTYHVGGFRALWSRSPPAADQITVEKRAEKSDLFPSSCAFHSTTLSFSHAVSNIYFTIFSSFRRDWTISGNSSQRRMHNIKHVSHSATSEGYQGLSQTAVYHRTDRVSSPAPGLGTEAGHETGWGCGAKLWIPIDRKRENLD